MKNKIGFLAAGLSGLLILSVSLFAHHGTSMYDVEHVTVVKGTVTSYEFVNPHVILQFDVKKGSDTIEKWTAESGSPNMMRRNGWSAKSMKPGDQVTVSGNRAKTGSFTMRLTRVVLPSGQELIPWSNTGDEALKTNP